MRKTLLCLACLLAAATSHAEIGAPCHSAAAIPQALSPGQRGSFEYATQLFVERRFAAAYGRLAYLADAGHLPSAQLALLMAQQGGHLFGSEWDASEPQLARWHALVGCAALRAAGEGAAVSP
jgi:hypothetical protein